MTKHLSFPFICTDMFEQGATNLAFETTGMPFARAFPARGGNGNDFPNDRQTTSGAS